MYPKRHSMVTVILVVICLIHGALSALTATPLNKIFLRGEDVDFKCSTDGAAGINTITWTHDSGGATQLPCSTTDASRYSVSQPDPDHDCHLTAFGSAAKGNQGPYQCNDGSGRDAEAMAIVIDPAPTCGLSTPPVRGEDATLTCVMNYYRLGDERRVNPGAEMTASIGWETGAGFNAQETKTPLPNNVGETLQGEVTRNIGATDEEVPSYTCTAQFQFANRSSTQFIFALNTVSYDCDMSAVKTWYCPTSVSISPNTAPYKAGGEVTCTSDGFPVSYKWTDKAGNVVSTSTTASLPQGDFEYTCTTSGNFSATCSESATISGFAVGTTTTTTTTTTAASASSTTLAGGADNTTDAGVVTGDTGLDLRTLLLLLLAAMLGALLLAALIIGCLIWRRRRMHVCHECHQCHECSPQCKPKCGAAFYQVTGGVVPAYMSGQKQCNKPSCVLGAYRPGCIGCGSYQMYGQSSRFGHQGASRFI